MICQSKTSTDVTSWQLWTQQGIIFKKLRECSEKEIGQLTKWQVKHTLSNIIEDFTFPAMINRGDGPQCTRQLRSMTAPDHAHALAIDISPF